MDEYRELLETLLLRFEIGESSVGVMALVLGEFEMSAGAVWRRW